MKPLLITPGDPAGIGPEIVWKSIHSGSGSWEKYPLVCIGARAPFEKLGATITDISFEEIEGQKNLFRSKKPTIFLLPAPETVPLENALPKTTLKDALLPGFQSGWSIKTATQLILKGHAAALVTGPISKERLQAGGYPYTGHTDFLADLCRVNQVTMMLANDQLRVALVTTHIALKDVPRALTRNRLKLAIEQTVDHLQRWWGIPRPRVAVAALNPHAGENGLFGVEEKNVIEPELSALRKNLGRSCELIGPLPADTLFAKHHLARRKEKFDAVVCMYHDQGLIPVKLLDFPKTVNVTLGLPIVRTSVDHGVAFDIAGKNRADPSSLQSALTLAAKIVRNRDRARH